MGGAAVSGSVLSPFCLFINNKQYPQCNLTEMHRALPDDITIQKMEAVEVVNRVLNHSY